MLVRDRANVFVGLPNGLALFETHFVFSNYQYFNFIYLARMQMTSSAFIFKVKPKVCEVSDTDFQSPTVNK